MHRSNLLANANLLQLFIDFILLVAGFGLAYIVSSNLTNLHGIGYYIWILIVYIPTWVFFMHIQRMYNRTTFLYPDRLVRSILVSSVASSIIVAALFYFIKDTSISRLMFGIYVSFSVMLLVGARLINVYVIFKKRDSNLPRVLFAGTSDLSKKFRTYLAKTDIKMNIIGHLQVYKERPLRDGHHLGYLDEMERVIKEHVVDEVIFALPRDYVGELEPLILRCEEMGITVRMVVDLYELKHSRTYLYSIGTLPVLTFHSVTINRVNLMLKRIIDIVGALVGLTITSVVALAVVVAIKIESPGPAIFAQERIGLNGRRFKIYKFRSMYMDAEERKAKLMRQNQVEGGFMFKIKDDPRITKVGKFLRKTSLDELPQFMNVLKGEMSLVGTRPPTVDEVSKYEAYHRRRLSFKPGLTGLWQVSGRSNITDFEEVVKLDTSYIDEWSLWLDIKIMYKTVRVVLGHKSGAM